MKEYEKLFGLFIEHLEKYKVSSANKQPAELYGPENYILSLGGKRLRPMMALIACDLFDKDPAKALDSALSVELFHNFSLIHDDILDAAPLRRNKETVHKKWNTNIAILSGDMMLVKALSVLNNYPPEEFKNLAALFTKTAIEVCEGQQYDMNFENASNVSVEDYIEMITRKTAVLLGCSLQMGAINAGADQQSQLHIYEFGKHLGIAFQLMDDLLDVYAGKTEFGKQPGGDIIANKKTFLLLKASELAGEKQKDELGKLMQMKEDRVAEKVSGVKTIFDTLGMRQICLDEANHHTQKAIHYLNKLEVNSIKKRNLEQYANQLLKRET